MFNHIYLEALLNAQDIQYTVVIEKQTIQGMFPEPALQSLRTEGKDLLNKKPF